MENSYSLPELLRQHRAYMAYHQMLMSFNKEDNILTDDGISLEEETKIVESKLKDIKILIDRLS